MAWASIGTLGSTANTANNQASITLTLTTPVDLGQVAVIAVSQDNPGAADTFTTSGAANPVISTVADSASNVWVCAGEFQNAQGSAQAGVVCSVWYTLTTSAVSSNGTITATFVPGSSASFDESAMTAWRFSVDAGSSVSVVTSTGVAADASTVLGVMDPTAGTTGSYLRVRAVATESSHLTALTTSSGWTAFDVARSANVAAATAIRGEWLITSSSTAASSATLNAAVDHASVYAILRETTPAAVAYPTGVYGEQMQPGIGIINNVGY